jgi:uncharacterized membrane protein
MGKLLALVFDDPYKADEARPALFRLEGEGLLQVGASAVITRRADARMRLTEDVTVIERKAWRGAGLVNAAVTGTFPLTLARALARRVLGMLTREGVPRSFVTQVAMRLRPGTSALVIRACPGAEHGAKIEERLRGLDSSTLAPSLSPES